jgi:hypothetical protein
VLGAAQGRVLHGDGAVRGEHGLVTLADCCGGWILRVRAGKKWMGEKEAGASGGKEVDAREDRVRARKW